MARLHGNALEENQDNEDISQIKPFFSSLPSVSFLWNSRLSNIRVWQAQRKESPAHRSVPRTWTNACQADIRGVVRNTFFPDNGRLPGRSIFSCRGRGHHLAVEHRHVCAQSRNHHSVAIGKTGELVESAQTGYRHVFACCRNSGGLYLFCS